MISLEQVRLLETKVTRAIDYVQQVNGENAQLKDKLDSYQKRIEELEVLIQRFKEEQSRIEDGILSALDRLNQFEDALESKLSGESALSSENKKPATDKPLSAPEKEEKSSAQGPDAAGNDNSGEEPALSADSEESDPSRDNGEELDIF